MYELPLQSIGLTTKEAAVYTALLGLGPSTVQVIARKAKVARGTTYVVLESLLQKDLVFLQGRGNRRYYVAQRPDRILGMLQEKRINVESDIVTIQNLLPALYAVMRTQERRPVVRYFEGKEGLQTVRQEMVMYSKPGDIWYNFAPLDALERVFGEQDIASLPRMRKGILSKTIGFTSSHTLRQHLIKNAKQQHIERKFCTDTVDSIDCGFTIFRDRIAIGCYGEDLGGMIIESPHLAALFTHFFNHSWRSMVQ